MPHALPHLGLPLDLSGWDRLRQPVWLFDPVTCRGLYANAPALELWGADSLDELLGRDFSQLSPAVRTRTERLSLATAGGASVTERWSFYPRGRPVTVQAVISAFPLEDGRTALLFEAAPVAVEAEELRAVEALRHTSTLISLFDAHGRATFANPAAFAAYGQGDRGFTDRFTDLAHGEAVLAKVLAGDVLAELGVVRTLIGERSHYLDARRVVDPVTGQASVLLSERDVTAQVQAERALRAAQERVEVAEAKQRFLANMSHELRTPLNSVLGFAGLLEASGLDPAQTGYLTHIADAGGTLSRIINNVIDLSELDEGEVSLILEPFDPAVLLGETLAGVEAQAAAKGLALTLAVSQGAPASVIGDAERLKKVVGHYLANAVEFTGQGQVDLTLDARAGDEGHAVLEVSVTDTGPGLDAATQGRLFRRFGQADDSTLKRFGGGGLGLAISKELIGLMGGEVGVESAPGQGARFWFRVILPIDAGGAVAGCDDADEPVEARPLTVLYADDHEANRALVQALLASQGHDCDLVCDGAEAVLAVAAGDYDLVLMDIQMPVQDGVSASREIRALSGARGAVPILALTANTLSEQRETYAAAGMNDCIAKPVNVAELFEKVAYWSASGGKPRARSAA